MLFNCLHQVISIFAHIIMHYCLLLIYTSLCDIRKFFFYFICILHQNMIHLVLIILRPGTSLSSSWFSFLKNRVIIWQVCENELQIILEKNEECNHDCAEFFFQHECCLLEAWRQRFKLFSIDQFTYSVYHQEKLVRIANICLLFGIAFWKL